MTPELPAEVQGNPAPPKFARYRKNTAKQPLPAPPSTQPPQATPPTQNASIARSMSRYRHVKPPPQLAPLQLPPVPAAVPASSKPISPAANEVKASLAMPRASPTIRDDSASKHRRAQEASQRGSHSSGVVSRPRTTQTRATHDEGQGSASRTHRERYSPRKQRAGETKLELARREAREILSAEDERLRRLKTQQDEAREVERDRWRRKEAEEARLREMEEQAILEQQRIKTEAAEAAKREKILEEERIANKEAAARIAALEAKKASKVDRKDRFNLLSRDTGEETGPGMKKVSKGNDSLKRIISAPRAVETSQFTASPRRNEAPEPRGPPVHLKTPNAIEPPKLVSPPPTPGSPEVVEPGSGGIVPGTDAPISAVNAEGRTVRVRCNESSINLPITPSTTPSDLIFSAANCLSECIEPKQSILLESFTQLGLERPLRKYEHIRDVLNSWDNDAQNTLLIISSPENGSENELDVKNAPREQPGDTSALLYHSMKPGHWDKRWVTLRSDGQVLVAKKADGEKSNICHLSDFDIYAPTPRQLSKKIKPPKKICFAVKSQQKSSMFLSGANFVHFFSTSDKKLAAAWYKAVQEWRSWYLVNVMGEGQKKSRKANGALKLDGLASLSSSDGLQRTGRQRGISIDSNPYQLGSFTPLFDLDQPLSSLPQRSNSVTKTSHGRNQSARENRYPPTSYPSKLSKEPSHGRCPTLVQGTSPREIEQATFAPDGLLGRTYSQRQKIQREREAEGPSSGSFLPGLTGGTSSSPNDHGRSNSMRSINGPSTGLVRNGSLRQKPKPLVDLTPVYQEPPQHARKGRGVAVEPGRQLVDIATGPEVLPGAIIVPPATAWRRPQTRGGPASPDSGLQRSNSRRGPVGGRRRSSVDAARPSLDEGSPFTGAGLLASRSNDNRPIGTGWGVATGDRNAKAPMLNVTGRSQFQEGSLLRSVEMHTGASGPTIDREKRIEGDIEVGEGI